MSPALVTLLTFLAVVMVVFGVYSILSDLFLRDRSRVSQRVDDEFRKFQRERARRSAVFKNQQALAAAAEEAGGFNLRQWFEALIEQSGIALSPRQVLLYMAATGLGTGILGGLLRQSLLIGGILGPIAASVPLFYVGYKRKVRLAKLTAQLPDAFDLMARVIRAGQTVSQALQAIADEFDPPIAAEFAYCYEQQNLGLPPELALRDLAHRTGLLEIKIFVLALLVQQQTGGNLAEILDNLAAVIRERFRIRGKISALTAEGRLQAIILLALPPLMFLIILFLNRDYGLVLLQRPALLIAMFVSELFGALWIRKIVNFDF
jgi:tight adherence protein B